MEQPFDLAALLQNANVIDLTGAEPVVTKLTEEDKNKIEGSVNASASSSADPTVPLINLQSAEKPAIKIKFKNLQKLTQALQQGKVVISSDLCDVILEKE